MSQHFVGIDLHKTIVQICVLDVKGEVVEERGWAQPMYRRMHKNKVRVALTRRLIISVWILLSRGEVFSLERCLGLAA